jgi:iron complex outermembrane receptor protein
LGYSNNGLGARLSGNWQSGTFVRAGAGSTTGDLTFSPLTTATLRIFADFSQMPAFVGQSWARGLRLTFTAGNITNERQKVRDQNGNTPVRYQPAYLDAVGRTVGITLRKLWL